MHKNSMAKSIGAVVVKVVVVVLIAVVVLISITSGRLFNVVIRIIPAMQVAVNIKNQIRTDLFRR